MKSSMEGFNQFNFNGEDAKAKFKLQNLLDEFLVLQKECVSKKRKLQAAKQRRDTILGEILFLKQRRRYLLKNQGSNVDSERIIPNMKRFNTESEVCEEEKFSEDYDAAVRTAHPTFTSVNTGYEVGDNEVIQARTC